MSRIIESCGQCRWMKEELITDKLVVTCKRTDKHVFIDAIPDFCPLPSLDDKLREVWNRAVKAVYDSLGSYDQHYNQLTYDEWREQNEH